MKPVVTYGYKALAKNKDVEIRVLKKTILRKLLVLSLNED